MICVCVRVADLTSAVPCRGMRSHYMNSTQLTPETPTGFKFGTKRDVAVMAGLCVRSVENMMAEGLPHLKFGKRRCRFDLDEVKAWLKERYSTQRLGKEQRQ